MKPKRRIIAVIVLLFLLLFASIPHLHTVESVDVSQLAHYPALQDAYNALCEDHSLYDIKTENVIQIATVRNLWGSWERYVLPCFAADTPTIPTAGTCQMTAFMHVLSVWEKENIFTKMCPLKLTMNVAMTPGENTFVYEKVDAIPVEALLHDDLVALDEKVNCDKDPSIFVYYYTATAASAETRDQTVEAELQWKYFLELCGQRILFNVCSIKQAYIVNA